MEKTINYWKDLAKSSIDKTDKEVNDLAIKFRDQLLEDDASGELSYCSMGAPNMSSALDKKTNIAHKIAYNLSYPDIDSNTLSDEQKTFAYIKYTQLKSKLKTKVQNQINELLAEEEKKKLVMDDYKKARGNGQYCLWRKLKTEDTALPEQILHPTAMPVEVAPLDELEPFLHFLTENGVAIKDKEYTQFKRGVIYPDGRIDLCKQVVGPDHIGKLMHSIKNNEHVKHFLLGNNVIDTVGAMEISSFILDENTVPKIDTWYLAGNKINDVGIAMIANSLKNDKLASSLWLKRNPLTSIGSTYIGEMLTYNTKLRILDLQNTGMFDDGVYHVFDGLKQNDTLRHLYLDANGITAIGAKYVANYFDHINKTNKKGIVSLWMEMNRLGDDGITLIANSLTNNKTLERFAFGSNRVESEGIKNLCKALEKHPKLFMLYLGMYKATADVKELGNRVSNEGIKYIAELLGKNNKIKLLNVFNNDVDVDGLTILADAISKNDTLLDIHYGQLGLVIPKEVKEKISEKLNDNCQRAYNMNHETFTRTKVRIMKHTKRIFNIESIYRNKM